MNNNKGLFITATDTEVGKTVFAAALIRHLRAMGINACGMKPVESDCRVTPEGLMPTDAEVLRLASDAPPEALSDINPIRFREPLAPLAAARIEGGQVRLPVILESFSRLSSAHDAVIVEGIGGLLVPLSDELDVLGLVQELGLPLVVVASPMLGTLNQTLLTVRHAEAAGIEVAGVVLNYSKPPENTIAEQTNPELLAELLGDVPLLGVMPHADGSDAELGSLDLDPLLR